MQEAMKNMPPEQRKQMEAYMKKMPGHAQMGEKGMRTCYTRDLLDRGTALSRDADGRCETTIKNQTSSKIEMSFQCKDGANGTGEWSWPSDSSYQGHMQLKQKNGQLMEMNFKGKYLQADCGEVKPYVPPAERAKKK
jgi:hypothetical protein